MTTSRAAAWPTGTTPNIAWAGARATSPGQKPWMTSVVADQDCGRGSLCRTETVTLTDFCGVLNRSVSIAMSIAPVSFGCRTCVTGVTVTQPHADSQVIASGTA